ncbi:ATP-dependent RecD-like DNA helicase [Clostridium sp. JN-9]|uniref:SF1B family DNA helicase RecD2 n=1 Tax=Clostridium sp. JN-9 TaxID=2507159 RepID=UPI000FFDF846|nr:ATP-dependent RecD-like DNA helicase [Clostridium sp. JN-9]QAT38997.1 ATP-dependent RecD-like DNA helicase [Clostridium sp. JN-9]
MQEIQGFIEDIVFRNEDNGYTVAKLKDHKTIITIVGCLPYIIEGQNVKLKGEWAVHPQFGEQFKVENIEEIVPSSLTGIERYLSSGIIMGIGPVTAKKIVEKFGEKTLEVFDEDIDKLKEIEGIGEKKLDLIKESYVQQKEIRSILIFLQNYGVTPNQCLKIYKRFGSDSISVVKNNPYVLTDEISGIGFKTADKIARSLGIEANSPFRIQSGIIYIVNQFCMLGNTYMPMDKLLKESVSVLGVKQSEVEENIVQCTVDGKLKIDRVENNNCVFTIPYYYCELGVTRKILSLCFNKYEDLKIDIENDISEFEKNNNINFAPSQKEAIKGAMENGVEIITGGPGTGKTTIINCITEIFEKYSLTVMMAAPTGRAAKRMTETTGREAKTIHRLLEMGINEQENDMLFNRGEESPLECDVVIVDEASMIDITLMNNLLRAISLGTRLIIVGDVDQLPSVGPGNVLRDLIESNCVKVVRLKDIFRQSEKSMITLNAHKINNGEMPVLNEKDKDFYFIRCEEQNKIMDTLIQLIDKRLPKFNKNWNKRSDIQILSPMRKGILGVTNLNKMLQSVLNPPDKLKDEKEVRDIIFRVGDKVMQTKNNYSLKWTRISGSGENEGLGIFNGDVGFIEEINHDNNTVSIIFDDERRVIYDNIYLDEIDLAYAITIHKSQGSEFPVVIMPIFNGPPLLMNRNLFYTGITRAKKLVVLVGSIKAMKHMIDNNRSFERYSLLKWRIKDIIESDVV